MKQCDLIKAYKTIDKLYNMNFDFCSAYKLFKLKKNLEDYYCFHKEEEIKLLKENNAVFNEDGSVSFNTEEDMNSFYAKLGELNNLSVDAEFDKTKMTISNDVIMSPSDIENLSLFIDFE